MELSETLEAITPAYAPPEVFHRQPPTEYGDVYSLGATLYALLADGRRGPERHADIVDMFERQDEPIERIPGVDDEFMDLLLAALADVPTDRPSAAQFRDRLSALTLARPLHNGSAARRQRVGINGLPGRVDRRPGRRPDYADVRCVAGGAAAGHRVRVGAAGAAAGNKPPPEELTVDPETGAGRIGYWILVARGGDPGRRA